MKSKMTYATACERVEALQAETKSLRTQLADSHTQLGGRDATIRKLVPIAARAREFADAWHAHPWTNQAVFDSGTALIATVRAT